MFYFQHQSGFIPSVWCDVLSCDSHKMQRIGGCFSQASARNDSWRLSCCRGQWISWQILLRNHYQVRKSHLNTLFSGQFIVWISFLCYLYIKKILTHLLLHMYFILEILWFNVWKINYCFFVVLVIPIFQPIHSTVFYAPLLSKRGQSYLSTTSYPL